MADSRPSDKQAAGFPEPPGPDPGDRSRDTSPHHALNTPVGDPDPTEWPDPYENRPDPLAPQEGSSAEISTPTGATSTSQPHPKQDPEASPVDPPERDALDS